MYNELNIRTGRHPNIKEKIMDYEKIADRAVKSFIKAAFDDILTDSGIYLSLCEWEDEIAELDIWSETDFAEEGGLTPEAEKIEKHLCRLAKKKYSEAVKKIRQRQKDFRAALKKEFTVTDRQSQTDMSESS